MMKKFTNWHKIFIGKIQNMLSIDSYQTLWFSFIKGLLIGYILCALTSCMGTYYLTDAEYTDAREENASITYYNNQIYWGWNDGYYYYYGIPHYYPWNYYYNTCPPSHHNPSTHIIIHTHVDRPHTIIHKPTHRPNRPNRPVIKTTTNRTNIKVKTNKTNIKTNNRSNVKTNSTNKKVTNKRRPR